MKKQVISILLTMTALLSMTSCSFSPELPELSSQETAAAVEKKRYSSSAGFLWIC